MMRVRILLVLAFGWLQGCDSVNLDPGQRLYLVRSDVDQAITFRIVLEAPGAIDEAERLLRSGQVRWVVGRLRSGDGGYNDAWSWHLDPEDPAGISFAEVTIEECQATPGYVEDNLDAWLLRQGLTCLSGKIAGRED